MKRKTVFLIIIYLLSINAIHAQKEIVLITIDDNTITKSEFERIYRKNNTSAVYDNKSVEDYLELFINYKLKVFEAERLGYDTISSFVKELGGYRDKLAEPYFSNKDIFEEFLKTGYERTKTEINVSHILVELRIGASYEDTAKAYEKIMQIRKRIINGEPFDKVALETSDDPSAKNNGGNLRWLTAFRMVYPFENVAYKTPVNEVSMPFRSRFGYHIIKVNDKRLSKGKIRLAHILVRTPNGTEEEIAEGRKKIYKYYEMLKNGEDFVDLVEKYSEDESSSGNNGLLKWIRSGVLPDSIEGVVYDLQNKGDLSPPLLSEFGWHIFRLQEKEPVGTLEEMRPDLERRLKRIEMSKVIEKANIEKLKKDNNFIEYKDNLAGVLEIIDSAVYRGDRKLTYAESLIEPIFKIGDKEYLQKDLAEIISKERFDKGFSFDYIFETKYNELVYAKVLEYEKSKLEDKYPDLKYLMQEYHDGILLFNLTDDVVWSKAVADTAGLEEFYEKNKSEQYKWQQRADASIYTLSDSSMAEQAMKLALMRSVKKITKEKLIAELCKSDTVPCVEIEDNLFEAKDNSLVDKVSWEKQNAELFKTDDKTVLVVINDILEPELKPLSEIKGLVTADYQTYLEREWVNELRNKYNIEVNKKALKKIK